MSCLAASPGYHVPVVLAGTLEGTVFAFRLSHGLSSVGGDHGGEWVAGMVIMVNMTSCGCNMDDVM